MLDIYVNNLRVTDNGSGWTMWIPVIIPETSPYLNPEPFKVSSDQDKTWDHFRLAMVSMINFMDNFIDHFDFFFLMWTGGSTNKTRMKETMPNYRS